MSFNIPFKGGEETQVQHVSANVNLGTVNVAISAVDTAKSYIVISSDNGAKTAKATFTSSTNVQLVAASSGFLAELAIVEKV